jgi:hypothetical protein
MSDECCVCEWWSRLPLPREGKGWPFRASAPCSRLSVYINSNSHALSSPVLVVFALIGNVACVHVRDLFDVVFSAHVS